MSKSGLSPLLRELNLGREIDWEPARLVTPGPWAGHIPFAHWLIKAAAPKLVVELGTHTGNSFSAFCNSIKQFQMTTGAFAVDTWQGDEHAGYYGEEVYEELKHFITTEFGEFANLVRSTFDGAISQFAPKSIDVLHIDGMHTYDAVKHDFLTWYDMLSERGIVLFHDTCVYERDFGVWKLWKELTERHPSFEFTHSNGLGILGVGPNMPPAINALFESGKDPALADEIRATFAMRGRRFELATELEALRMHFEEETARRERQFHEVVDSHRQQVAELHVEAARRESELREAADRYQQQIAELREVNNRTVASLEVELGSVRQQKAELANALGEIYKSTSWRVTRPLRLAKKAYQLYLRRYAGALTRRVRSAPITPSTDHKTLDNVALRDAIRAVMVSRMDAFLLSDAFLRLPHSNEPDVTIVLILFNQAEMTYSSLAAIKECLDNSSLKIETILFDNGSTDRTHELLDRLEGAQIIRNEENLHFLRGVNAATRHAKGRHILLLNNDAQLTPGSLEAAVKTLDEDPSIGAVGARIILPDGTLQEAGSIIWSDGSCLGYGRGQNPNDPQYMFQRDVDYCSGAFLLTPRHLFERMGGFDEAFAPAYYEETDYCVRLWEANLRVVYNPRVTIHHFEFASSGSVSEAIKLQQRNLETFRIRHASWLSKQYTPDPASILLARFHTPAKPRILYVEDRVPKPWQGAGFPRSADIVREFVAAGMQVTIFPTAGQQEDWHEIWQVHSPEVEVVLPLVQNTDLRQLLHERKGYFDAIFVTRPHNMKRLQDVFSAEPQLRGDARLIYDAEALFAHREILKNELEGAPLSMGEQSKLIQDELALTRGADLVLSVSAAERKVMQDNGLSDVAVLGHKVESDVTQSSFESRKEIFFLGAIHGDDTPNADSIRWFVNEVLPELRLLLNLPALRLQVVGLVQDAPSLQILDGKMIDLRGRVDDLKSLFETARLAVVPTRFAAGIPHKAHHVASLGVPMVATDLIAQQLGWTSGRDILSSTEPHEFARHCRDLYTNQVLWNTLRSNALTRIEEECSVAAFRTTIRQVIDLVRKGSTTKEEAEAA